MTEGKTRVFHGGRFHQKAIKKTKESAEEEKERLQNSGHNVRVTPYSKKGESKKYRVWVQ